MNRFGDLKETEILIVGSDSGIGSALVSEFRKREIPVAGTTRRGRQPHDGIYRLDLGSSPDDWKIPDGIQVAYLCAAVTKTDSCVEDPAGSRLVNVTRTLELARRLRDRGVFPVFLSTSLVFDGSSPMMDCKNPVNPRTEYGRQKADAEEGIHALGGAVVRMTKVMAPGRSLLDNWFAQLRAGQAISPFSDMVLAPLSLSFVLESLIRIGLGRIGGTFHLSPDSDVTYADLALGLIDQMKVSGDLLQPLSHLQSGRSFEWVPRFSTLKMGPEMLQFDIWQPKTPDMLRQILAPFQ